MGCLRMATETVVRLAMGVIVRGDGEELVHARAGDAGVVVRVYNPLEGRDAAGTIRTCAPVRSAYYVDLLERDVAPAEFADDAVVVAPLGHCKFQTIRIEF